MNKTNYNTYYLTGFTLIELLIVIAIMIFLAGITVTTVSTIQANAKKGVTSAQIGKLELALKQFESDFGVLPPDNFTTSTISIGGITIPSSANLDTGNKCIVFFLGSRFTFNPGLFNEEEYGPYIEFKRSQITGTGLNFANDTGSLTITGVNGTREVYQYKDPFGSFYSYISNSPSNNTVSFDIYSFGPDKKDDSGVVKSDDITNW
ncbi:MAG: type II secretion system protein GspG [Planctomycetota bacterium]|jgi:prepilin-type N-terminal cleavage/methylation domain-containing protein